MAVTNSPRLGLPRWSEGTDLHPNRAELDAQQGLLDDLVAIDVEVATYADRPAPKRGIYMWVVDEQRLYRATATGWMTTAKIGGGGRGTQIVIGANSTAVEGVSSYAARADHTHTLPLATAAVDGAMAKADKAKIDTSTAAATNNALAQRDASGGSAFTSATINSAPSVAAHATRKDYVDAGDAARFPFGLDAGTASINTILTPGQYQQSSATPVTIANGYPLDGAAGSLTVTKFGSGAWAIQEWIEWSSRRRFLRGTNGGASSWSQWREFAGIEPATESADGLMPKADKALVNTATISAVASALVKRDSNSQVNVPSIPTSANHATSKSYTDATVSSAVSAIPLATSAVDGLMPKADKAKLDNASNSSSTTSNLVMRGTDGRISAKSFGATDQPSASADLTRKDYVDSKSSSAASAAVAGIPMATAGVNGLMYGVYADMLDYATYVESNSTLVRRSSTGIIDSYKFRGSAQPEYVQDLTRKDYVDSRSSFTHQSVAPSSTDLNTLTGSGNYYVNNFSSITNLPSGWSGRGLLEVRSFSSEGSYAIQRLSDSNGRIYNRGLHNGTWTAWKTVAS